MAKCIRCGKSTALRGTVKLSDAILCGVCFKELGFEKRDLLTASIYKYDDIKDGRDAYYLNKQKERILEDAIEQAKDSFRIANHGQLRDVNATDEEAEIFELIKTMLNISDIKLVRKADNYVTAIVGEWDLARFKYTDRARWISFPIVEIGNTKNRIESVEDVKEYADKLDNSLSHIRKYSD